MIRIPNWTRFQHYKNRNPPWIKLHKQLLDDPEWGALPGGAAKLLIELWLLASETDDGCLQLDSTTLAWRLRRDSTEVADHLQTLAQHGLVEDASTMLAPCKQDARPEVETEREKEESKKQLGDVENSKIVENPTWLEVKKAATELGKGKLSYKDEQTNADVLRKWRYKEKRKPDDCLAAIKGACLLRDEGVGWLEKGQSYTLAALYNTRTLADQGDGETVRPLWSVAQDRYYEENSCEAAPRSRRYGIPQRVDVTVANI